SLGASHETSTDSTPAVATTPLGGPGASGARTTIVCGARTSPSAVDARTVNEKVPTAVGVPESSPPAVSVSPGGRTPADTAVWATVGKPPRVTPGPYRAHVS